MYVYVQSEPNLWTCGHYAPDGRFQPESDHPTADAAAARVHWLNGGRLAPKAPRAREGRASTVVVVDAPPDAELAGVVRILGEDGP